MLSHIKLPTCYWFSLCFAHELLMLLKRYINSLAALLGWIILLEHLYQSRYIYNLSLHNCWKCVLFRFISLPWQGSSNLDRPCHILLELVFYILFDTKKTNIFTQKMKSVFTEPNGSTPISCSKISVNVICSFLYYSTSVRLHVSKASFTRDNFSLPLTFWLMWSTDENVTGVLQHLPTNNKPELCYATNLSFFMSR